MPPKDRKDHHAAAAVQHAQAAQFHREASRHFEVGKDREHWAHQALIAHDHTLRAIDCGNEARNHYGQHEKWTPLDDRYIPEPFPTSDTLLDGVMVVVLQQNHQHAVAADHHVQAARHHDQASRYCALRNYESAAEETKSACRHAQQSLYHSREALRQNVENHAPAGQIAGAGPAKQAKERRM